MDKQELERQIYNILVNACEVPGNKECSKPEQACTECEARAVVEFITQTRKAELLAMLPEKLTSLIASHEAAENVNQELRERNEKLEEAINQIGQVTGTCENDHVEILAIIEGVRK